MINARKQDKKFSLNKTLNMTFHRINSDLLKENEILSIQNWIQAVNSACKNKVKYLQLKPQKIPEKIKS